MAPTLTFLTVIVVSSVCGGLALAVIHAGGVSTWWRELPQRLRGRGWGLLLAPVGVAFAMLFGTSRPLAAAIVLAGVLPVVFAPKLARKAVPYATLVLAGMSLQAAERLFASNPEAALALVGEAKESSSRALTELRDLVRGIYPPVLADRGLGDAIRALALDTSSASSAWSLLTTTTAASSRYWPILILHEPRTATSGRGSHRLHAGRRRPGPV